MIWIIARGVWIVTILAWWCWGVWWLKWISSVKNSIARKQYSNKLKMVMIPTIIHLIAMVFPDVHDLLLHKNSFAIFGFFFDALFWSVFIYQLQKLLRDDDFFTKMKSKFKRWARNTFTVRRLAPVSVTGR